MLLRQQLLVLRRQVKRPELSALDRAVIVGASAITSTWRETVLLVKPDTILRWHRQAFQRFWRWRTRHGRPPTRVAKETVELIQRMAGENRLWGAERIRGELLKLGIRVAKRTIQRYLKSTAKPHPHGQRWATALENHANDIWACDFIQTYDIWFRPIFAFFIINHGTREVLHKAVTRAPSRAWTAQQGLRQSAPVNGLRTGAHGEVVSFPVLARLTTTTRGPRDHAMSTGLVAIARSSQQGPRSVFKRRGTILDLDVVWGTGKHVIGLRLVGIAHTPSKP